MALLESLIGEHDQETESRQNPDQINSTSRLRPCPPTPQSPPRKPPSEQKTHYCTFDGCDKAFNRPARLAEHIRSHTNERIFKCPHEGCNKDFLRGTHLSHHVKSAHSTVRDYVCEVEGCGKRFLTGTRLNRHRAAHEGRDKYRCLDYPPCDEVFRKHSTLQRHIVSVHLNQKPFPCTRVDELTSDRCSEAFDTAAQLRKHEGRDHGGLRFWCVECSPDTANSRKGSAEEAEGASECNDSQAEATSVGFPTYALLQTHQRTVHPPICGVCSEVCTSQRGLRQHMEIHEDGSGSPSAPHTHRCDFPSCDRAFSKPYTLTVHKRTVHQGERRFVCGEADLSRSKKAPGWTGQDGCGKAFQTKGNLEEHVRTQHLGLPGSRRRPSSKAAAAKKAAAGADPPPPPLPSTISQLTGAGYAEENGRAIPCLFAPGCAGFFRREYDLDLHLQKRHGLADAEIEIARLERGARSGGKFWTGGDDGGGADDDDDDEAIARAFDAYVEMDLERHMEMAAAEGGEFWLSSAGAGAGTTTAIAAGDGGGGDAFGAGQQTDEMEWQTEMAALVGERDEDAGTAAEEEELRLNESRQGGGVEMIDPDLRYA